MEPRAFYLVAGTGEVTVRRRKLRGRIERGAAVYLSTRGRATAIAGPPRSLLGIAVTSARSRARHVEILERGIIWTKDRGGRYVDLSQRSGNRVRVVAVERARANRTRAGGWATL